MAGPIVTAVTACTAMHGDADYWNNWLEFGSPLRDALFRNRSAINAPLADDQEMRNELRRAQQFGPPHCRAFLFSPLD